MSFSKLDRYKSSVKAVARKTVEIEPEKTEIVPTQNERKIRTTGVTSPVKQAQEAKEENPFSEPDSEKNIIFLDKAEVKTLEGTETQATEGQIKGATLYKLIERATNEKYADPNLQSDFLLTYRSFTTPRELLKSLVKRYNMPVPKDLSYGVLQEWKQGVLKPIRLRVINIIKNWVEKYWKDFTEDPEMSTKLHDFLYEDVVSTGFQTSAEQLSKLWDKKRTDPEQERGFVFSQTPPKPFLPNVKKSSTSSVTLGLLDFHSEEIARQLTLIEFNLYKAIKPWEFFNQGWTKKNKEINSPNVLKMIERFNKVSTWVTTEIVKTESLKQRVQVLAKFLEVAEKCRQYNNFNALMEIVSGLQSSPVFRLKQTWAGLSSKQKEFWDEMKDLMARAHNWSKLRQHFKTCDPPLIPYLGMYLTDLTFIEDGNPDLIEGGLINWVKRRRLATVIKDIQQYQQKPYCLEEVPFIQEYLLGYTVMDEDTSYKLSLQRETRTADKDKEKKSIFSKLKKPSEEQQTSQSPTTAKKTQSLKPEEEEDEEEDFELQYKAGYKFYDKDSEQTIIVEKDPKGEAVDTIIAGTLPKLVERLTYEKYPDVNYLNCFLLTYRTFVSSNELLDLLFMRYQLPPPVNPVPEVMEQFKMKKETPIQLRVLNAFKTWVDKHFDDFREDKQLLTRLVEFVDNYMINSPTMQRAGQNFKAQITNKVESKEEKKVPTFSTAPPTSILPTASNPGLLDFSPEELARQLTLIDYDLYTSIKKIEYLYFNKPSSWALADETQQEDDQDNLKNASHIVAVVYRFTDVRDWVATQVVKADNKEARAKVIDHFIQVANHCVKLNNLHTFVAIASALNNDFVLKLKATWKLVPKASFETFLQLRNLMSYRSNYKALRDKLAKAESSSIPYLGLYIQDLAIIKEQMPDTIEPYGFVNFAKRQKMANLIHDINYHQQTPYNLSPVLSIQEFLKTLDIYESGELMALSEQYQETDGDKTNEEDIFAVQASPEAPVPTGTVTPPRAFESPRASNASSNPVSTGDSPRGSVSSSPRVSVSTGSGSHAGSPSIPHKSPSSQSLTTEIPTSAVTPSAETKQEPQPQATPSSPATTHPTPAPASTQPTTPPPAQTPSSPTEPAKSLQHTQSSSRINETPSDAVDSLLLKVFPGAKISTWKANDTQGAVFGWPGEEITAKVVTRNADSYLVPLLSSSGNQKMDKAELSVCLRVGQFYESQNAGKKLKIVAFAHQVGDQVKPIASKVGIQVIIAPALQ